MRRDTLSLSYIMSLISNDEPVDWLAGKRQVLTVGK
jgi:hypothetical protein